MFLVKKNVVKKYIPSVEVENTSIAIDLPESANYTKDKVKSKELYKHK